MIIYRLLFKFSVDFVIGKRAPAYIQSVLFSLCSIAAACYTIHYAKRLYETVFVHRFSHSTMPIMNLFKNCGYYWGFTAYVAYHVCHPLYTSPSQLQVYLGLAGFAVSTRCIPTGLHKKKSFKFSRKKYSSSLHLTIDFIQPTTKNSSAN